MEASAVEYYERGNRSFKDNQFELASRFYTSSIEMNPPVDLIVKVYSNRALCQSKLRNYKEVNYQLIQHISDIQNFKGSFRL